MVKKPILSVSGNAAYHAGHINAGNFLVKRRCASLITGNILVVSEKTPVMSFETELHHQCRPGCTGGGRGDSGVPAGGRR